MHQTMLLPTTHIATASRVEIATRGVVIAFANDELAIRLRPTGKGDVEFVVPIADDNNINIIYLAWGEVKKMKERRDTYISLQDLMLVLMLKADR